MASETDTSGTRRERAVQGIGLFVALLMALGFVLPSGLSSNWQFGWDADGLVMIALLMQSLCGIALGALLVLPLSRLLKGIGALVMGVVMLGLLLLIALDRGGFGAARWLDVGLSTVLPAIGAAMALASDSHRPARPRAAMAMIAGAAMAVLALVPVTLGGMGGMTRAFSIAPHVLPFEVWELPSRDFSGAMTAFAWAGVTMLGPIAGALFLFHGAATLVSPQRELPAAGTVAGTTFLLWGPATAFVLWLAIWSAADVVFTTYFVAMTPALATSFLIAAGVVYLGDGLEEAPARAASIHPGLAILVRGGASQGHSPRPAAAHATAQGSDVGGESAMGQPAQTQGRGDSGWPPPSQAGGPQRAQPAEEPAAGGAPAQAEADAGGWPPRPGRRSMPSAPAREQRSWAADDGWSEPTDQGWSPSPEGPETEAPASQADDDFDAYGATVDVGRMIAEGGGDSSLPSAAASMSQIHDTADHADDDAAPPPTRGRDSMPAAPPMMSSDSTAALDLDEIEQKAAQDRRGPSYEGGDEEDSRTAALDLDEVNRVAAQDAGDDRTAALDLDDVQRAAATDQRPAGQESEADRHWRLGGEAWQVEDWPTALRHYEQVARLQPQRTEALRAIADIHYGLGNLDDAEQYYRLVLEDWPDDDYTKQALGQIRAYREQGH